MHYVPYFQALILFVASNDISESEWPLYKFENPPRKLWEDIHEQRNFLDFVGKQVFIYVVILERT